MKTEVPFQVTLPHNCHGFGQNRAEMHTLGLRLSYKDDSFVRIPSATRGYRQTSTEKYNITAL